MNQPQEWLTQPGGLANRLAALRTRTNLSGKDFAERLGWPASKVSRIENGRTMPSAADLDAWVRAVNADPATAHDLMMLLEDAQSARRDWRRRMGRGQLEVQADYEKLEQESRLIRYFETTWVPGLLQTPDYAHRVLQEMLELHGPKDDVDEAVAQRMRRQRILYEPGREFEFLIGEPVLRWRLLPPAPMRAQLHMLQTVIDLRNVRFGVLPFEVELSRTPQNSVQMFDDLVIVETAAAEEPQNDERAAFYRRWLDELWTFAATGPGARRLIVAAADALPAD